MGILRGLVTDSLLLALSDVLELFARMLELLFEYLVDQFLPLLLVQLALSEPIELILADLHVAILL